ncbi:hypothetical protein MKO06_11265 [Gramella sp. GC03-9]|uniref:Uncharacterized protein n=1 Tax=Christiangramia oceanisediminis TaxID=2920386 RepID=A0A9X2KY56_9FLAO|nr:hypothetical protein [Gramella oceanisediminis]MCP9200492.1 hypothetical protein [Gramella oceanisediminis]
MSLNAPISIFLSLMFMAKLFLVDASFMQVLSGGEIRIEKAYCKKKTSISENNRAAAFVAETNTNNFSLELLSSCTPQFNFFIAGWDFGYSEPIRATDDLHTSRLSYLYLEKHSPPPKIG